MMASGVVGHDNEETIAEAGCVGPLLCMEVGGTTPLDIVEFLAKIMSCIC
jgi:hypothetical protein